MPDYEWDCIGCDWWDDLPPTWGHFCNGRWTCPACGAPVTQRLVLDPAEIAEDKRGD